jgi:dTDP-glucose 4,6-dehydratase
MDASKIKAELGWEPLHPFEFWIEKTIDWYLKNQDWVQKVANKAKAFHQENLKNRD